ncbi:MULTISPECIES: BMC domain-containing protein [Micromonospora]|uniref:BMC domain-containing protein n=1 Tax=Micromonospora yangpuensis TaxID=683228 RepID=A0A1C6ULW8_9ACTN|nr:BMC domain-containing protein [Micromonospora yangpuensis]GGM18089.1 hypothetical protein GCM10012279_40370 [Micromonospora yangpuensis]SCL54988.1 BMC domain-containing protein [Micromonospora yangpuensis]
MDLWDTGALGVVETHGLTASIVAVDVMAKAAQVRLIGVRRIGDGIVTVSVVGDMASVTAAVESARLAVTAIGGTVASTVIGRPAVPTAVLRDAGPVEPPTTRPGEQ